MLAILATAGSAVARGAPGLDPSFATNGLALTPLGVPGETAGVDLGFAPDGSVIIGNGVEGKIVRLLPDGLPDGNFGTAGELVLGPETTTGGDENRAFLARQLAVDGSGRVLVFGAEVDFGRTFEVGFGQNATESSAVVLRLDPEGNLDPSFGEGEGFVRSDFGFVSGFGTQIPMVGVLAGSVDSRDRPVLVAGVDSPFSGCYGKPGALIQPRAVVRLSESGQPDPTFGGGDGVSPIDGSASVPGLAVDAADQPVVGAGRIGGSNAPCEPGTAVYRFGRNGGRLKSFGSKGVRVFTRLHFAFAEPSGVLVLSRRHGKTLSVVRIRPDGGRDMSFGRHGVAEVPLPVRVGLHVRPVAVDSSGRILLAGFIGSPIGSPKKGQPRSAFVVARLRPDGSPDLRFGSRGWIFTPPPRPLEITGAQATLDRQGRLVVAGSVVKRAKRAPAFAVARYLLGSK